MEMVLNKNPHEGICARLCHGAPVPFSVWKELSQLQGSLPVVLLHWTKGTRREADWSESGCWEPAQKRLSTLFSLYSSAVFTSLLPLVLLFAPRPTHSWEARLPLLCGDVHVFRGTDNLRPGACTERQRRAVMQIHTVKRDGKETRGKCVDILCSRCVGL